MGNYKGEGDQVSFSAYEQKRYVRKKLSIFLKGETEDHGECGQKDKVLADLFEKFSHSMVFSELSSQTGIDEVLDWAEKTDSLKKQEKSIKTIGTYCSKMYDGGVERVLACLCSIWDRMGYRVVLYTDIKPNIRDYSYPKTVKRIVLPAPGRLFEHLHALEESLKRENVDVFVNHNWMPGTLLWEMLLVKSMHIPFIVYTHEHFTALYGSCTEYVLNSYRTFRLCDMVISLAKINARFYQLCGCNSFLIQNPISEDLCKNSKMSDLRSHKILWIGRITKGKRPCDAIEIFKIIKKYVEDAELEIVGTGDDSLLEQMRYLCRMAGIENEVHFHGYQQDVTPFYAEAALMLMTSEKEGYPTVFLESKAYGLPCVLYDLPYLSMIEDRKGILSARIGDVSLMAGHAIKLLQDEELRKNYGREARESFECLMQYDIEKVWSGIFESLERNVADRSCVTSETTEQMMMSMFVEQLRMGVSRHQNSLIEYRIGRQMLRVPRKLYHILRNIKHMFADRRKVYE